MPARPTPLSVESDPIAGPALAAHETNAAAHAALLAAKQDAAAASDHAATSPAHGGDLAGTARPPTAHAHPQSDVTGLAGALDAKADLAGGKVPTSQIPALATGETVTVTSQAAMLALTASQVQPGDVAIRSDQAGRRWLLAAADPSLLASWIALEVPDAVSSVNSQQGAVVLGKGDVGLGSVDDTADTAKPVSTAQQTAFDAKQDAASAATDAELAAHTNLTTGAHNLAALLGAKAPLASPQLTGTPRVTSSAALKWEAWDATQQVAAIRSDNPNNVGVGKDALLSNTVTGAGADGLYNTALGFNALRANTTGTSNSALGFNALLSNTTGNNNTAVGRAALQSNTTGISNTAVGWGALQSNTTGFSNTAAGMNALQAPGGTAANATTTALRQTALGVETGQASATQRDDIVAVGYRALVDGAGAVAVGSGAQSLHAGSVALGMSTVTTAIDQVMVGPRDVEITLTTKGIVLKSADGTRYRVTVLNGGTLSVVAV